MVLIMYEPFFQHITYGSPGSSSNSIKGDAERDFFVELWDVSGHERYKDCRSLFYAQINGKKTFASLPYCEIFKCSENLLFC